MCQLYRHLDLRNLSHFDDNQGAIRHYLFA